MASLTPRFKLNYFGAGVPGGLTDDGLKFTGLDRLTIDRVLQQLESADHHYHARSVATVSTPSLTLGSTGGLAPGTTYFYRVTFVTTGGLETSAGPEVSITTPPALTRPTAPTAISDAGGTLKDGLYYYALTATRSTGSGTEQSLLSDSVTMRCTGGDNTAILRIPTLTSGNGVNVWRMHESEGYFTKVGTAASAGTFTDTGTVPADPCGCTPDKQPPATARGSYVYAVTVTVAAADAPKLAAGSGYTAWRVYRSTTSGSYSSQSLVAQIVERESEFDMSTPLLDDYVDLGEALLAGRPPAGDITLDIAPYTFDSAATAPSPSDYPENYPIMIGGALNIRAGGAWKPLQGAALLSGPSTPTASIGALGDLYVYLPSASSPAAPTLYGPKAADGTWPTIASLRRPALLSGTVAPTATDGASGDFYLDSAKSALYGPKAAGGWPVAPVSLAGGGRGLTTSTNSPTLDDGVVGDYWIRLTTQSNNNVSQTIATLYGPKKELGWPDKPTYLTGVPGTPGVDGENGLDGAPGAVGPALNIVGTVTDAASLPAASATPAPVVGDAYFIGSHLWVYSRVSGWIDTGAVQALDSSRRQARIDLTTLATSAEVRTTAPLAIGYRLMRIETSRPARVRLYGTAAQQVADASRVAGRDPSGNHGVVLDVVTTDDMLRLDLAPQVYGASLEDAPSPSVPMTVMNNGTAAGLSVIFTYVRTE